MSDTPYDHAMSDVQSAIEGAISEAEATLDEPRNDPRDRPRWAGELGGLRKAWKIVRTIRMGQDPTEIIQEEEGEDA